MTRTRLRYSAQLVAACAGVAAVTVAAANSLAQFQQSLRSDVQNVLSSKPIGNAECRQKLTGPIEATNCDYESLESVNEDLFDSLHSLVTRPFFKFFRVDLYRECPFWTENGLCSNQNCGVTSADESQIPEKWRAASLGAVESADVAVSLPGCYSREADFCFLDDASEGEYVDLSLNPERFTGYAGESAHRIWSSIYNENCFGVSELSAGLHSESKASTADKTSPSLSVLDESTDGSQCLEKRVYYRVVSGLHASISTHICWENMKDQKRGEWGPDLSCFITRVASNPERLQNIYFNTVLLLRALARIQPYLATYDMCSGDEAVDNITKGELSRVFSLAKQVGRFDETQLFRGENAQVLKAEFKDHFRNVSRIMDCVGCDKCRLWGKVQTTGVATALKILFELDEDTLNPLTNPNLLQRSELVALINTLHRFSESLHAADYFRKEWAKMDDSDSHKIIKDVTNDQAARAHLTPAPPVPVETGTSEGNGTLFESVRDAMVTRVAELVKACEKGTAVCLQLITDVFGGVTSLFQPSSKHEGPMRTRPDL
ncbi:endoplasmic oxidoreductin [Auriculariales sp. MPI-PUGE-AT-0066]|nr:endoplasmic oxidoreductin [Auriculariales sp. MPI-PUGE-AT-0066]